MAKSRVPPFTVPELLQVAAALNDRRNTLEATGAWVEAVNWPDPLEVQQVAFVVAGTRAALDKVMRLLEEQGEDV